jgi:hypothetical protein
LKTRATDKNDQNTRKKYFRQPKIYQNDYIVELQESGNIIEYLTEKDPFEPEFKVLYLFFQEKNEVFLMLGREESGSEGSS